MVHYEETISYVATSNVLECWELARQRHASEETIGMEILLRMFVLEPRIKQVFGFQSGQTVSSGISRMGLMVHGLRIVLMLDTIISTLGPDLDSVAQLIDDVAMRHLKHGVKANFIPFLGNATIFSLKMILAEKWREEYDDSWQEVFSFFSSVMIKALLRSDKSELLSTEKQFGDEQFVGQKESKVAAAIVSDIKQTNRRVDRVFPPTRMG